MKTDVKSLTKEELALWLKDAGEPAYRGAQLFRWLHREKVCDFSAMTNLPAALREKLAENAAPLGLALRREQVSSIDGTRKVLLEAGDGCLIESVSMLYEYGRSVCISSQAGCRMGCSFCASTLNGLVRSLSAGEMLEQVYFLERGEKEPVSHVVVMGMGEPFDNYENLLRFLRLLSDPEGRNLGARHITVSTCGLVPGIRSFAEEGLQVNLAVSLHAADQKKREALMPVARSYALPELMEACRYYVGKTNRRITFEYSLVKDRNDGMEDVKQLISLLKGLNCHVNLIPVNEVRETGCRRPERERIRAFREALEKAGIPVTLRRELGRDIDASCGQLRNRA